MPQPGVRDHAHGATVGEPGAAVGDDLLARREARDDHHALADDRTERHLPAPRDAAARRRPRNTVPVGPFASTRAVTGTTVLRRRAGLGPAGPARPWRPGRARSGRRPARRRSRPRTCRCTGRRSSRCASRGPRTRGPGTRRTRPARTSPRSTRTASRSASAARTIQPWPVAPSTSTGWPPCTSSLACAEALQHDAVGRRLDARETRVELRRSAGWSARRCRPWSGPRPAPAWPPRRRAAAWRARGRGAPSRRPSVACDTAASTSVRFSTASTWPACTRSPTSTSTRVDHAADLERQPQLVARRQHARRRAPRRRRAALSAGAVRTGPPWPAAPWLRVRAASPQAASSHGGEQGRAECDDRLIGRRLRVRGARVADRVLEFGDARRGTRRARG